MKIYTKKGDQGETGLYGGTRIFKSDLRIEAYGTLDELNSYLGLIRALPIATNDSTFILEIQAEIFSIGSHLAASPDKQNLNLPEFETDLVSKMESEMDKMNDELPDMKFFILPGGNINVSHIHVARAICRRGERRIVELNLESEISPYIIQFLNRLSDYLFVLARKTGKDQNSDEVFWRPN